MPPDAVIPAPPAFVAPPEPPAPEPEAIEPVTVRLNGGLSWMNLLMWLLGSLGLTGVLAVCGFILQTGSEDFWGYHLARDSSAADYVTLFGELVYAGFSSALQWAGETWWRLPLALAVAAGAIVGVTRIPDRFYRPRVLFLSLGILALVNFAWTDVPTFFVRDMLVDLGSAGANAADGMVGDRAQALRQRHICSRLSQTDIDAGLDDGLQVNCTERPARYRQALRNAFVLNMMLGLVNLLALAAGAMWMLGGGGREFNRTRQGRTWRLALTAAAAMLLMDVANVPYHYAKTARPTQVQKAMVRAPALAALPLSGFLLSDGQDRLVLYNDESFDIWLIPRSGVVTTMLRDPEDVLSFHIQSRLEER